MDKMNVQIVHGGVDNIEIEKKLTLTGLVGRFPPSLFTREEADRVGHKRNYPAGVKKRLQSSSNRYMFNFLSIVQRKTKW